METELTELETATAVCVMGEGACPYTRTVYGSLLPQAPLVGVMLWICIIAKITINIIRGTSCTRLNAHTRMHTKRNRRIIPEFVNSEHCSSATYLPGTPFYSKHHDLQ